jgi:uncharacterized protein YegP (UPF0339 family)
MSGVKFRPAPTYASGGDDFQLSVSEDGQVFTLTFAGVQAVLPSGASPAPVAARLFSLVLPVDGGGNGVDISFRASGFALTTEGTSAYAVLSVNGDTSVEQFPSEGERDFVQELRLQAGPTCECGLAVSVLVERDAAHPEAAAHLNVLAVDAQINPRAAGKFVLEQESANSFHFNLQAPNGEVIATSERYENKASALNDIESVRRNAPDAEFDDQTSS